MPSENEQVIGHIKGTVLKETTALHLKTKYNFTDIYKQDRKAGEEWLVTNNMSESHILDVY